MSLDLYATCSHCGTSLVSWNFTHNMIPFWRFLGCLDALYESKGKRVSEILPAIESAVAKLATLTDGELARFDSSNGWGLVSDARPALVELLGQLRKHPDLTVDVSR